MRKLFRSDEFEVFFRSLRPQVQHKLLDALKMVEELPVIHTKLVKKLAGTDYYELRISMDNEYRAILLAVDHDNIMNSTEVYILNGFVKKSTKDYKKQLVIADNIVKKLAP